MLAFVCACVSVSVRTHVPRWVSENSFQEQVPAFPFSRQECFCCCADTAGSGLLSLCESLHLAVGVALGLHCGCAPPLQLWVSVAKLQAPPCVGSVSNKPGCRPRHWVSVHKVIYNLITDMITSNYIVYLIKYLLLLQASKDNLVL